MSDFEAVWDDQLVEFVKHVKDRTNREFKEIVWISANRIKGDGPYRIVGRDLQGAKHFRQTFVKYCETGHKTVTLRSVGWRKQGQTNVLVATCDVSSDTGAESPEVVFSDSDPDAGKILFL